MAQTKPISQQVRFTQDGTGAVERTVDDKLKETVSVTDFGAVGDGVTDDTAAILAAIDSGASELYFPSGTYNVTSIDVTGKTDLCFKSIGKVNIIGTSSTHEFIIGSDGYNSGNPGSSVVARRIRFDGEFSVQTANATYVYGLKMSSCVEWRVNGLSVSGQFTHSSVYLQYSYSNQWRNGSIGNYDTGSSGTVYGIFFDNNNVNNNLFDSIRVVGTNNVADNQIGVNVAGTSNTLMACDISAISTGVGLNNDKATSIINCYFEATGTAIKQVGSSITQSLTVSGGYIEILQDGVGIDIGATQDIFPVIITGVYFKGLSTATNRTAINLNNRVYSSTIANNRYLDIDTDIAGNPQLVGGVGSQEIAGCISIDPSSNITLRGPTTLTPEAVTGGFKIFGISGSGAALYLKTGSPEGSITATAGSLCLNTAGGASTTLYVKESGTGNTGWVAK